MFAVAVSVWLASPARSLAAAADDTTADAVLIQETETWNRRLARRLALPDWLDLGVEQRTRYEALIHPFRPDEPNRQIQYPQRTRLRLQINGPRQLRLLGELQDSRAHSVGPDDFTNEEIDRLDILQLFVSVSARNLAGSDLRGDLHAGRLTLDLGSRRLVARNSYRNTTNAFDGLHVQLGRADLAWRVRGFYVQPVAIEVGTFDDRSSSSERLWGLWFEDTRSRWRQLDLYYIGLRDTDDGRHYTTLGTRLHRPARRGQLDYQLELIEQFGTLGEQRQDAYYVHAESGYSFKRYASPRLFAQLEYASGTADPGGSRTHTFDPLFNARRFELIPTGIYGPFERANIRALGLGLDLEPTPTLKLQLHTRYWQLAQKQDAFAGSGLSDPSGQAGRNLGLETELGLVWTPRRWLEVETGLDYWWKGSYFDTVPDSPTTANTYYVWFSVRVQF